jgi:galactose oxidase
MFDIDNIFVAGGSEQYDVYGSPGSNRAYVIDLSTDKPVVTRQPNMRWRRVMLNLVVLPNGFIVVLGGQMAVALFSDQFSVTYIEMYDPYRQNWTDFKIPLSEPRTYHSVGLLLKDGRVLSGGGGLCGYGCDYEPWNHANVEIVTPPYLLDADGQPVTSRPSIVTAPATFVPDGQITVTMDTSTLHTFALMRLGASTHTVNLDQRRVPLAVVEQVGTSFTLKIPTNPAHVIPGQYWLFAMNEAGVPSTGWDMTRA